MLLLMLSALQGIYAWFPIKDTILLEKAIPLNAFYIWKHRLKLLWLEFSKLISFIVLCYTLYFYFVLCTI